MSALQRKNEEANKTWKRMARFYNVNGKWFFSTREKTEFGPFLSQGAATKGLEFYLNFVGKMKFSVKHVVSLIHGDPWQIGQYK